MRVIIMVLALASVFSAAHGQQVYKCAGRDGVPSYQSEPCAEGHASKTWDASQPYVAPAEQARIDRQRGEALIAQQRRRATSNGSVRHGDSGPTESQQRQMRCDAARRERDAYFERRGLRRTYDELSRWDQYVRDRCK